MTIFRDLVEETQSILRGWTRHQDQVTYLTAHLPAMGVDGYQIAVRDASRIGGQVIEIGDELIEVETVDRQSGVVTVPPFGRGVQGTIATSHAVGDRVTSDPLFPRFRVKRALNDSLLSMGHDLYSVHREVFEYDATKSMFALPADASGILSIQWRERDHTRSWQDVKYWRYESTAAFEDFTTGVAVWVGDAVPHGTLLLVVYTKNPVELADESVPFTDSGLPDSARDAVCYGAVWRLLSNLDGARLATQTVAGRELADRQPVNVNSNLTQQIWRIFQVRLDAEVKALRSTHPGKVHFIGR